MYQKSQYESLAFKPNRDALPQRPQTPSGHPNQHSQARFNQSYTNNPGSYSPHKFAPQNNNPRHQNPNQNPNISRSRVSVASSNTQLSFLNADQGEVFPEDLLFLLKN